MLEHFDRDPLGLRLVRQTVRAFMTLTCVLVATATAAKSQEMPADRPTVTIVHPFTPGGVGYDLAPTCVAEKTSEVAGARN